MQAENATPETEDVRKKALLRLAVAGVVTAAALGGLWWLDQSDSKQPPVQDTPPAPIVSAAPPQVAAPQTETPAEMEPTTEPAAEQETASAEAAPAMAEDFPKESPPPPRVSNNLVSTQKPFASGQPAARPTPPPAVSPAPPAVAPTAAALPAIEPMPQAASGKGYVVQLGVFSNPDNARELVTKLNKQGIRAHMEARVQLGPFLNRQEAEKAQIEMRKLGYNALLTLPFSAVPAMK
jgi:DedD protein